MSMSTRLAALLVTLSVYSIPALGMPPSIDEMMVTPGDPAVGWGTAFTVTAVVTGGTPPYTYSWTQIGGTPIPISGQTTGTIAGTTPTRVENLTALDRTSFQVTGWGVEETTLEFWCTVSDSLMETDAGSAIVTITLRTSIGEGFVGEQTEVVLNGADQPSYSWSLVPPAGSSAGFVGGSAGTQAPFFFPDAEGTYVATEAGSGEAVTVLVGRWKGVGTIDGATATMPQCGTCHSDLVSDWEGTGHSIHYSERG